MDYNDTYEREIDLKELMFAVLRKWKAVLVFAVAMAVLFGGYKGILAYQSNKEASAGTQDAYAKELETYNENMELYTREIENITQDIASQEEYLEKSILMNTSPYDVWEAKAEFIIKAGDRAGDQSYDLAAIIWAYQSALTSSSLLSEIAEDMGMDFRYIQELVTVTPGRDSYYGNDGLFSTAGQSVVIRNRQNDFLTVQVRYNDERKAKELLDNIVEGGMKFKNQIQSSIGSHTISEVSSSISSGIDFTLADKQNNEQARLQRLKESLQTKTDELDNLENPEVSAEASPVLAGAKYGVIGAVMGAFLVVFFVCVGFVMSDKVYSAKELKYRFKIKILGTLSAGTGKAGKIDAWLSRLEGRAYDVDEEHEFGLISANIRNYTEGIRSLLIIGNAQEELVSKVASELADRQSGMKVVLGGNVLRDANGLRKLPECDGIVLVEQCGESLYSEVELEIEKVSDLKKTVVGCVVFE